MALRVEILMDQGQDYLMTLMVHLWSSMVQQWRSQMEQVDYLLQLELRLIENF